MSAVAAPPSRIGATILTGFLGAGKTTLLSRMLRASAGRRIAVIVNEFGEIGCDRDDLLRKCGGDLGDPRRLVELADGCICCAVADEFVPAMLGLLSLPEPPDHVVIETSGLALPQPLAQAFQWGEIQSRAALDGIVAAADADALASGRLVGDADAPPPSDHDAEIEETFVDQISSADVILLTKTDLLSSESERLAARRAVERFKKPETRVLTCSHGNVAGLEAGGGGILGLLTLDADPLADSAIRDFAHDDHEHEAFESAAIEGGAAASRDALVEGVRRLARDSGALRVKGVAAIEGSSARLAIQAVGGRVSAWFDRPWREDEIPRTRLAAIAPAPFDADEARRRLLGDSG